MNFLLSKLLCKSYYQVRLVQNSPDALYSLSLARTRPSFLPVLSTLCTNYV